MPQTGRSCRQSLYLVQDLNPECVENSSNKATQHKSERTVYTNISPKTWTAKKLMKTRSASFVVRKMQIEVKKTDRRKCPDVGGNARGAVE